MLLPDFDARQVAPQQGGTAHPVGMFEFTITNTYLKETKNGDGLMLIVEMTSPVGVIENRYNILNPNKQAEEISNKQLSALCHAVNIFKASYPKNPDGSPIFDMAARELRGGRGRMEVAPQMRKNDKGEMAASGYVEVKKVFDSQGNEPGKPGSAAPQPMQQAQPNGQGGPVVQNGWGNAAPQQPMNQQPMQQPMQQLPQQPYQQPPMQQQPPGGGWVQSAQNNAPAGQPNGNGPPPWAQGR